MTKEEASRRYHIPAHILDEYESWGLCGAVKKSWAHGSMTTRIWSGSAPS